MIYGTNPAGGGYQGISPTLLLAHKDCNIAVGGAGIVSGMAPKGYFDEGMAEQIIEATRKFKSIPPGRVEIHYDSTGFFREVHPSEESLLDIIKVMGDKAARIRRGFLQGSGNRRNRNSPQKTFTASLPSTRR